MVACWVKPSPQTPLPKWERGFVALGGVGVWVEVGAGMDGRPHSSPGPFSHKGRRGALLARLGGYIRSSLIGSAGITAKRYTPNCDSLVKCTADFVQRRG